MTTAQRLPRSSTPAEMRPPWPCPRPHPAMHQSRFSPSTVDTSRTRSGSRSKGTTTVAVVDGPASCIVRSASETGNVPRWAPGDVPDPAPPSAFSTFVSFGPWSWSWFRSWWSASSTGSVMTSASRDVLPRRPPSLPPTRARAPAREVRRPCSATARSFLHFLALLFFRSAKSMSDNVTFAGGSSCAVGLGWGWDYEGGGGSVVVCVHFTAAGKP